MFNTIVAAVGGLILTLGLCSKWLDKTPVPATLLALLAGVVLGLAVLGWVDLAAMGELSHILESAARLTLGIGLVSVAMRIPKEYLRRHWREMVSLISLSMAMMWGISTCLVFFVLGLPFWLAALIGAIVTPTDPVAATPIVTGALAEKHLPERLRWALSFESGANDGLAYLFVFLPFLLLIQPAGEAMSDWLLHTLLWEIGAATLCGLVLGYLSARLL